MAMTRKQIITTNKEDINYVFEKLDLTGLEKKLKNMFGFDLSLTKTLNDTHIKLSSERNLVDEVGILAYGLKSVYIQDFGVIVYKTIEYEDIDLEIAKKSLDCTKFNETITTIGYDIYVIIDARYTLKAGGSNGISLLSGYYNLSKKEWTFN